jgi:hypothetical protein
MELFLYDMETYFPNNESKGVPNCIMCLNVFVIVGVSQEMDTHWVY